MRVAKLLRHASSIFLLGAIAIAIVSFEVLSFGFWFIVFWGLLLTLATRLFANAGQILFEMRAELLRTAVNIERATYQSNAILREIRDLVDEES
jgi:hypothetical protein